MKILGPIKMKSTGKVIGYFYRMAEDGKLQYVSFSSTVCSVELHKVEPATQADLQAAKERQRQTGHRGS